MAVIVASSGAQRTVVVERASSVATVTARGSSVQVPDAGTELGTVSDRAQVLAVSSPGPQGQTGVPGGTSEARVAAHTLGGHRVVRSAGAGAVGYASSDNPAHGDDTIGITLGAAVQGDTVQVQRFGPITFNGWAFVAGEPVLLGVDGQLTQVAPSVGLVQVIGHAESATTLYVQIQPPIIFD